MNFAQTLLEYLVGGNQARNGANLRPPHRPNGTPPRHRMNPGFDDAGKRLGPKPDRFRIGTEHGRVAMVTPVFGVKHAMRRGEFKDAPVPEAQVMAERYLHSHKRSMLAFVKAAA